MRSQKTAAFAGFFLCFETAQSGNKIMVILLYMKIVYVLVSTIDGSVLIDSAKDIDKALKPYGKTTKPFQFTRKRHG